MLFMPLKRHILFYCFLLCTHITQAFQLELKNGNDKIGVINISNNEVILESVFEQIGWPSGKITSENIIRAQKNKRWALYDRSGKQLTPHEYVYLERLNSKSFIASKRLSNSILQTYGLINKNGKETIPFEHLRIEANQGLLIATQRSEENLTQSLYNSDGKLLIPPIYSRIQPLNNQHFDVQDLNQKHALFDEFGNRKTAFEFQEIEALNNDHFLISYYDRLGVINNKGELVVPPIYRRIFQRDNEIRTEGYPEWTYVTEEFQRSFFFDEMHALGDSLFLVEANDHLGVINKTEEYKVYLEHHSVVETNSSFAIIRNNKTGYYGLLNRLAQQILPANFDSLIIQEEFAFAKIKRLNDENWIAYDFSGNPLNKKGYSSIKSINAFGYTIAGQGASLGLIGKDGLAQTPFEFISIKTAGDNQMIVQNDRGTGLISSNGTWLITPYRDSIKYAGDHYQYKQGSANGITTLDGKLLVKSYDQPYYLPQGYYINTPDGYQPYDFNEQPIFDNFYDTIRSVNDKLWYLNRENKHFFYRPEDQFTAELPESIEQLGPFAENYISFKKDGQWGFLDEVGQLRIANRYDSVANFSEGIAPVKLIGKWGAINRKEEIVLQPEYDSISGFYNALSVVKVGEKYGLVDRTGRNVLDTKYDFIKRNKDWIYLEIAKLKGVSDIRGRIIKSPQYDKITVLKQGYFLVEKGSLKGVINESGRDLIPIVYEEIKQSNSGFLALKKGKTNAYPIN